MNNELKHYNNPLPLTIFWVIFYIALIAATSAVFYMAADQVRSHALPAGDVTLSTDYSKYVVGETVSFTIKNNYNSSIYLENNCPGEPLAVYKSIKNQWVRQHAQAERRDCPTEPREVMVGAGQSVTGSLKAWSKIFSAAGKYRIVAFVEYYNSLPYKDIEIIDTPKAEVINNPTQTTTDNTNNSSGTTKTTSKTTDDNTSGTPTSGEPDNEPDDD